MHRCNDDIASVRRPATELEVTSSSRRGRVAACPLCGRELKLTFHHLIPKKLHRRPRFKRHYSKESLALGIYVCRDCHDGIHAAYSEIELAQRFAEPEAIVQDPTLARHFAWVARQRRSERAG